MIIYIYQFLGAIVVYDVDHFCLQKTLDKFSVLKKDKIISSLETNFLTRILACFCRTTGVELTERGQQRLRSRISNLTVQFQCEHARFVFPT